VLVAILLLSLNLRSAVTAVPPLLARISADVGLSPTLAGVLGALPAACFGLAGAVAPPLLRRFAAERVIVGLIAVLAAGQVIRPWLPTPAQFLVCSAVVLLAMGVANVLLPAVVKAWFPNRIGAVTAMYVTGLTVGTAVPPLLVVPIADAVAARSGTGHLGAGWHVALAAWGALAALAALPWLPAARHPRVVPGGDRTSTGGTAAPRRIPLYRSRIARGILLIFGTTSLNFYAIIAWLPHRLTDAGLSEASAGAQLSLVATAGVPLAIFVPPITARLHRPLGLVLGFAACLAVGYAGLLLAPTQPDLDVGDPSPASAPAASRCRSPWSACARRTRPPPGPSAGFVQGFGYTAAGLGPLLVGALYERSGRWAEPFTFLAATIVLLVLGGWMVTGRETVDAELARRSVRGLPRPPPIPWKRDSRRPVRGDP
jgi:CP family cyanate transporter-like MFS transporter